MKRIDSLNDLLMEELAELLDSESQLATELPKMIDASQSDALKDALERYSNIARGHVGRLEDIFNNIRQNAQRLTCKTMKRFVMELEGILNKKEKGSVSDIGIISVAQQAQQYGMTSYKTVREHAADLGHTKMVELFTKALNEQRAINFHFNELAQYMINVQATESKSLGLQTNKRKEEPPDSQGSGFYIPQGKFGRRGVKKKNKNTDGTRFIREENPED